MATIKPVSTQNVPQATAFKGKNNYLKELASKVKCPYSGKKLTPEEAAIERISGAVYAMKGRSPEELKETALLETMLGNTDFVKGINDVLAKSAAKNGYKPQ